MTSIFAEVVNMSCMAIWLILAVIIVRLLCRKTTKNLCYLLWALVGIRLLCPFTIESPWSMIPNQTSFEKLVEIHTWWSMQKNWIARIFSCGGYMKTMKTIIASKQCRKAGVLIYH